MYSALRVQIDQWLYSHPRLNGKLSDIKCSIRNAAHRGEGCALIDMDFLWEDKDEFCIVCRILDKLGYQYNVRDDGVLEVFW